MLYMTKPKLVVSVPFLDQKYICFSMQNEKYVKFLSGQQCSDKLMRQIASIIQLWVNGIRV